MQSEKKKASLSAGDKRTLNSQFKKLQRSWALAERDDVLAREALGRTINEIKQEYGISFEEQATRLGKSKTLVSGHAQVARTFLPSELKALLKRANGKLSWSALIEICQGKIDKSAVTQWTMRVIEEGLSIEELRRRLANGTEGAAPTITSVTSNSEGAASDANNGLSTGSGVESDDVGEEEKQNAGQKERSALRHWGKQFAQLAGQAELIKSQAFAPLEATRFEELEAEPLKILFEDLTEAQKANEALERVCRENAERLKPLIGSVQAAISKGGIRTGVGKNAPAARTVEESKPTNETQEA